jgi:DNA gyrase inhibitor GyrI
MNVADIDNIISEILNDKITSIQGGRYKKCVVLRFQKALRSHHKLVMQNYRELKKKESRKKNKTPNNKLLTKAMKMSKRQRSRK